jgi:hypothetical protein
VCREAREAASGQSGLEAAREAAHGFGIERDCVTGLDLPDLALDLDGQIAARYEHSDDFELRECALRALWHALPVGDSGAAGVGDRLRQKTGGVSARTL